MQILDSTEKPEKMQDADVLETTTSSAPAAPLARVSELPEVDNNVPPPSPLHITEPSDLEIPGLVSFTPSQLYEMNQNLYEESMPAGPLIDEVVPMSVLRDEYNGAPSFVTQIDWLSSNGYHSIRRARRDGDCFYRSLGFAYIERVMRAPDRPFAVVCARSALEPTLAMLAHAGFEKIAYEDPYQQFLSLIDKVLGSDGSAQTPKSLLESFQNSEVSNSVIFYLRLLTSAQIRTDPDSYAPFLFHPETGEPMQPREFCEYFVDSWGKEADHVQITALSRALKININIAYLDGRGADGHVDFVEFRNDPESGVEPLILLYRPGHYDILLKDVLNKAD